MKLYHHTTQGAATQILTHGFNDTPGDSFLPGGVWLSDSPDISRRAMRGHAEGAMLMIEVPDDLAHGYLAAEFPPPLGWHEFCIPAEIVNRLPIRALAG